MKIFKWITLMLSGILITVGCTLSFQNVMTSGTATDVVDSSPNTDANLDGTLNVPLNEF